jgi:DNA primase
MSSLDDVKHRILNRVPLADLVGETVDLDRGSLPKGCCPFHGEKTPSFYVYPNNRYFCYGCKASGDAIEFVRKTQGLGFIEALRYLAGRYNIDAHELDETDRQFGRQKEEASLYEMLAVAQEYFQNHLWTPEGEEARAYLAGRGYSAESMRDFGFGLTPAESYGLVRYLRSKGFREPDMIAASLATKSTRDGKTFDFFRSRITIPIRDGQGRIIAFGGRTTDNNPAKYLNSKDTVLFDKSSTLYGFDRARKVMRQRGRAIVVEGYMDTLQLWQSGFPETVACLGTAFTEQHLKQLKHATTSVVLLLDGDDAGQRATLAAVQVALTCPEVHVKAATLTGKEDPDSFVRKHGPEALDELCNNAEDLLDFAIREKLAQAHGLAVPDLVSREFVPWLAKVPDRMQRSYLTGRIATLSGIPAADIEAGVAQILRGQHQGVRPIAGAMPASQPVRPQIQKAASPDRYRRLKPLAGAVYEIFGLVFHATPGEIDPEAVAGFAGSHMQVEPEYLEFLTEMLTALRSGTEPRSLETGGYRSTVHPDVVRLFDRLQESSKAFAVSGRAVSLIKIFRHFEEHRIKTSINTLKAELARLTGAGHAGNAGSDQDARQILKTIAELNNQLKPQGNEHT